MISPSSRVVATACWFAAICATVVVATEPSFVCVVHRHGARMPTAIVNKTISCPDLPCGQLLPEGKDMLRSLGATMRSWYNAWLPQSYKPWRVRSRSTDIDRTLQSADGFLRGMFPNLTDFYPAINTISLGDDFMLNPVGSDPAWMMHGAIPSNADAYRAAVVAKAKALGLDDPAIIAGIARDTNQYALCYSPELLCYCFVMGEDFALSYQAQGTLDKYPTLAKYKDQLAQVIADTSPLAYFYNASDSFSRGIGSPGQELAQAILSQASEKAPEYRFVEYSAHDTTLMPLYVTLGLPNGPAPWGLRPKFAEAAVFEATEGKIRAFWGDPVQTPGNHTYTFAPLPLRCITSNGTTYVSAPQRASKDYGCPLGDWARYLSTSAGAGACYFSRTDQKAMCPPVGVPVNATTMFLCNLFREKCPSTSCPAGYALDYSKGSACVKIAS